MDRHHFCVACLTVALALSGDAARAAETASTHGVQLRSNVVFGSGGGRPLLLDEYRPKGTARLLPAIVFIHGGAWRMGGREQLSVYAAAYALRGYYCVTIEYRLSGEAPFPAALEDVKCAVRWVRANAKELGVDPDRVAAFGASAGGHLAVMLGVLGPDDGFEGDGGNPGASSRVQAVVDYFGPTDLTRVKGLSSGNRRSVERFVGEQVGEDMDAFRRASPLTYVTPDDAPMLIVQGTNDRTVQPEHSRLLRDALAETGVDVELLEIPNARHVLVGASVEDRLRANQAVERFLEKQLKDPARGE